jgi:MSHA biogenesis protein MshP
MNATNSPFAPLASHSKQGGFSLISAIFLLVVIAALGAFAITLSTTQQQGMTLDVLGVRAYQAARSGIEWGAFQIIQSNVAPTSTFAANCQAGATSTNYTPAAATLNNFSVQVSCSATSHVEPQSSVVGGAIVTIHTAASPLWVYQLTASAATASAVLGSNYVVERQLNVSIAQ